jgi:ABC-type Fe3+/spermidine/putrescine transport system ATPase subunit
MNLGPDRSASLPREQVATSAPPPAAAAPHLRLAGVTKRFGSVTAVDGVDLALPRGAFVTLLGPSGCGKTTLLRLIAGFYEPDGGALYLDGRRIDAVPPHRRGMAMVFQDYALFPHLRVVDNVAYGLRLAGRPRAEIARRVSAVLDLVGLAGLGERWPNELSGGQQQRVALARALVVEPEVLLLDEPLSNLDAKLRERMRWELRALQRRLGLTFVYVTHDQDEALAMSDWIAVMNHGRVEQWGPPWEIYYRPRTPFLADFVGAVNLAPGRVVERAGDQVIVALGELRLALPAPAEAVAPGDAVLLCIRPESLALDPESVAPGSVRLAGAVLRRAFLGHLMRYWVQAGDQEWIVDQPDPGAAGRLAGGAVTLAFHPSRVHVIPRPR